MYHPRTPSLYLMGCLIRFLGFLLLYVIKVDSSLNVSGCSVQRMTAQGMTNHTSNNSSFIEIRWKWTCKNDSVVPIRIQLTDDQNGHTATQSLDVNCVQQIQSCKVQVPYFNPTVDPPVLIQPCTSYSIKWENDFTVTAQTPPWRKDLEPSGVVVTAESALGTNITFSVSFSHLHPRCANELNQVSMKLETEYIPANLSCSLVIGHPSSKFCSLTIPAPAFDLCHEHRPVLAGLLYNGYKEPAVWFNSTLQPRRANSVLKERPSVNISRPEELAISWNDPECLIVSSIVSWRLMFRKSSTIESVEYEVVIPSVCVMNRFSNRNVYQHNFMLVKDQIIHCPSNSPFSTNKKWLGFEPCAEFTVEIIPLTQDGSLDKWTQNVLQKANFSTPLDPSYITKLAVKTVASTSFELEWRIPHSCARQKFVVPTRINNATYEIKDVTVDPCPFSSCPMKKNFEQLTPCTRYSVSMGLREQVIIVTYPDFSTGAVTSLDIDPANLTSPKISWRPPTCHLKKILRWFVQLRNESNKSTAIIDDPSQLFYTFNSDEKGSRQERFLDDDLIALEPCKTYQIRVGAEWEGRSSEYWAEQSFTAPCDEMNRSGTAAAAVVIVFVALVLATIFCMRIIRRARQKEKSSGIISLRSIESKWRRDSTIIGPLKLSDLCQVDAEAITNEFNSLKTLAEAEMSNRTRSAATKPENKIKNRFNNIQPYDFNRVMLSILSEDPHSDYINASFIPGFNREKEFIAAQGPKRETLNDFWRMIWEQNVNMIVMVTPLREDGRTKCEQYWPDEGAPTTSFEDIQTELVNETVYSFYATRTISALKLNEGIRIIKQLHFTAWSDFDSPEEAEELIQFVETLRQHLRTMNDIPPPPILVHCSAGVGRTGTLIAIDHLIQQVQTTDTIDIFNSVLNLRRFRVSMVQSESQYQFVYTCLAHYVETRLQLEGNNDPVYENVKADEFLDVGDDGFENLEYENIIRLGPNDD